MTGFSVPEERGLDFNVGLRGIFDWSVLRLLETPATFGMLNFETDSFLIFIASWSDFSGALFANMFEPNFWLLRRATLGTNGVMGFLVAICFGLLIESVFLRLLIYLLSFVSGNLVDAYKLSCWTSSAIASHAIISGTILWGSDSNSRCSCSTFSTIWGACSAFSTSVVTSSKWEFSRIFWVEISINSSDWCSWAFSWFSSTIILFSSSIFSRVGSFSWISF